MKGIFPVIWAEALKIRRSKMLWISILVSLFMPMMMGLLMFVAKNPELAYKFGLLGTKATILKIKADWPSYIELFNMAIAGGGLIGFGFLASWVFGREYSDRTSKDLIALPVPRSFIVLSKFTAVAIWCVLLSFILIFFGLLIGLMINLAGWSNEIIFQGIYTFAITSFLTILLCTPVAFFACFGRGYLAPIGFVILTMVIAQFVGVLGFAPYFPWAVPMIYTGAAGAESAQLGIISYIILYFTSFLGLIATLAWWRFADQF
jgi:ABC-type transport system involved in multi-copper enzyme maturation permease subunit